jgi:hypothetical protein
MSEKERKNLFEMGCHAMHREAYLPSLLHYFAGSQRHFLLIFWPTAAAAAASAAIGFAYGATMCL